MSETESSAEQNDDVPAEDPWDEFIEWCKKLYADPDFDAEERDYKLVISEHLAEARAAVETNAEDWQQLLKRAFGTPNNLTYHITHSRFLGWAKDEPDHARAALLGLWDETTPLPERVEAFTASLPDTISASGGRLEIASFLLLVDPTAYAMYKPTPIKTAAALVEYPEFPNEPDSAIYLHALDFLDEFLEQARSRGLALRDRLDAQGLVWTLAKYDATDLDWSDEDKEAFLRYRGERPSVWWVNQGGSYSDEFSHQVVSAPITNKAGHVLQPHKNVSLLRKGDIILHHADGAIRAISQVSHKPEQKIRSWRDDDSVARVTRTTYFPLDEPISVRDLDGDLRIAEPGPFDSYGSVKQVYLMPVSVPFSDYLRITFRWPDESPWGQKLRPTWLFQANPAKWDLPAQLAGMNIGDEADWTVSRYKAEIADGDRVILWQSGPNAGIHGIGQICGELQEREQDEERFGEAEAGEELKIPWRLTEKVDPPLLKKTLLEHPVLKGLHVITSPMGSNFRVTDEQWSELRALLDGGEVVPSGPVIERTLQEIGTFVANQGLIITDRTLRRFHVSLRTRGFVILSGISGTGKTWLSEVYAEAVGAEYLLVPVAPNWTTNEDLLGYLNPLDNTYHDTSFSRFLRAAADEWEQATTADRPARSFILTLDEMNLARVEYYFAKFLSAMEVRSRRGTADLELSATDTVQLTPNLLFVGTVNVDETTHGFADKVFDRAQLIEMEAPREAIANHIGQAAYRDTLLDVYDAVADSKPFAFRVVDELKAYVGESETLDVAWADAIDEQILQKVLTKLTGADPVIRFALERMIELSEQHGFDLTRRKAEGMLVAFDRDGFTSYF